MSGSLLAPPQVVPQAQAMGAGMPNSALAASLIRGMGAPMNLQNPMSGVPLSTLAMMMAQNNSPGANGPGIGAVLNGQGGNASTWGQSPGFLSGVGNGISNLFSGQPWSAGGPY